MSYTCTRTSVAGPASRREGAAPRESKLEWNTAQGGIMKGHVQSGPWYASLISSLRGACGQSNQNWNRHRRRRPASPEPRGATLVRDFASEPRCGRSIYLDACIPEGMICATRVQGDGILIITSSAESVIGVPDQQLYLKYILHYRRQPGWNTLPSPTRKHPHPRRRRFQHRSLDPTLPTPHQYQSLPSHILRNL